MRIKEVMSQPPVTCSIDATLDTVARVMWECDCGFVPLVDADGRVAGVLTDRDICMAAYTQGLPLGAIPAQIAVSREVFACGPDDRLESAEAIMSEQQIRRIPVVDRDGRPVGVLAMSDLARTAARAKANGLEHELVETLAAISAPRYDDGTRASLQN